MTKDCVSRDLLLDGTICDDISCNGCSFNKADDESCLLRERIIKLPSATSAQKKPEKVKAVARIEEDEWYGTKIIRYYCPKCGERISEKQQACEKCLIFFDWRQKAYIKTIQNLEWR